MNKKFILCVGIPKAGTTWLYRALQSHPDVNLGHKKEYHVFDTAFCEDLQHFKVVIPTEGDSTSSFYKKYLAEKRFDKELQENHQAYAQYFAKILNHPQITLTGDFTPTYCILNGSQFQYIQALTQEFKLDTHIIYLVRDPMSALLAYVNMAFRFKHFFGEVFMPTQSADDYLQTIVNSQICLNLLDYQKTITTLLDHFERSKLYFGVYETMHQDQELEKLSDFLGVHIDPTFSEKRINANTKSSLEFDPVLIDQIKIKFKNQFLFCKDFFKTQDLASHWKNYSSYDI